MTSARLARRTARASVLAAAIWTGTLVGSAALGSGCGSGSDGAAAAGPVARPSPPPAAPPPAASPSAPPGVLSAGSMWARGRARSGGGGGRPMGREILERNRQERLAREGPQRPPSERREELQREGQERARELAEHLPPDVRTSLESRTAPATERDAVRQRCEAMLAMNEEALRERGDRGETTGPAFLARCERLPVETFNCADRGEEGRSDPDCRQHLAVLDREVRTLRRQGDEVRNPDRRIDTLVTDQWQTERQEIAPEALAPDHVD